MTGRLPLYAQRMVRSAIRDIEADEPESAIATLQDLLARTSKRGDAPEPEERRVKVVPIVREPLPELPPVEVAPRAVVSLPKPEKYEPIPAVVEAYRAAHPVCEVAGDDCWYAASYPDGRPKVEVHHIVKRSMPGCADHPGNFLALCTAHHTGRVGWHPLTPPKWFARFIDRLSTCALAKVNYFLRTKKWNPQFVDAVAAA